MQNFRDLKVWSKAHAVALSIYENSEAFPASERYGITSQMRRAATSIPSNIAEGCGRSSNADLARFLHIAFGSASELEYLLLLARDLGFLQATTHDTILADLQEVKRMLTSLITRVKTDD
ncbi:MAG TPA: four helix bundle protein [Stellaceae bacterium]|nr:four helix bundle protein [Stellaceae bacterium]